MLSVAPQPELGGSVLHFGGRVLIDTDGQGFLEVHPDGEFTTG